MQKIRDMKQQTLNGSNTVEQKVYQEEQRIVKDLTNTSESASRQLNINLQNSQQEKIYHLESAVDKLIFEIDRLNKVIIEQDTQIKNSQAQVSEVYEANNALQNQLNAKKSDDQVKSLEEKIRRLNHLHEQEVASFQNQINSLTNINRDYENQLQITNSSLSTSQKYTNDCKSHAEKNINILTREIERLSLAIRTKDQELEQREFKNKQDYTEIERLNKLYRTQGEEVEQYRQMVRNLQEQNNSTQVSSSELVYLRQQIDDWKKRYQALDSQKSNSGDSKTVEELRRNEQELRDRLALSYKLIDDLKKQVVEKEQCTTSTVKPINTYTTNSTSGQTYQGLNK